MITFKSNYIVDYKPINDENTVLIIGETENDIKYEIIKITNIYDAKKIFGPENSIVKSINDFFKSSSQPLYCIGIEKTEKEYQYSLIEKVFDSVISQFHFDIILLPILKVDTDKDFILKLIQMTNCNSTILLNTNKITSQTYDNIFANTNSFITEIANKNLSYQKLKNFCVIANNTNLYDAASFVAGIICDNKFKNITKLNFNLDDIYPVVDIHFKNCAYFKKKEDTSICLSNFISLSLVNNESKLSNMYNVLIINSFIKDIENQIKKYISYPLISINPSYDVNINHVIELVIEKYVNMGLILDCKYSKEYVRQYDFYECVISFDVVFAYCLENITINAIVR